MRRRLVVSTIAIALVVIGALAVPVGIIVFQAAADEARARLDQQAALIAAELAPALVAADPVTPAEVGGLLGPDDAVRITDASGRVIVEQGPLDLVNPISIDHSGPGGTRIELQTARDELDERFRRQVYILLALAAGGISAAGALAAVQARQLARPLERLAASAGRLGEGDFSVRGAPATGIGEIDDIAQALQRSSRQLDTMLADERHFTADATHQLRSGLTGIAMRFELLARHGDPDVVSEAEAGLHQTDQLNTSIDELLAVARQRTSRERTVFDLVPLVQDHVADWSARLIGGRPRIRVVAEGDGEPSEVLGTKGLAGQVIDLLIDNALVHGAGTVTVTVSGSSVTVADQGTGFDGDRARTAFEAPVDPSAAHGRGLRLARRMAEVDGGTVEIVEPSPPAIRYRLPASSTPADHPGGRQ